MTTYRGTSQFKRKTLPENPRRSWAQKTCVICADIFYTIQSQADLQETCSPICSAQRRASSWDIICCEYCGEKKKTRKVEHAKYCSFECSRKSLSGENHPRWTGKEGSCINCGATFESLERKYCSKTCAAEYRRNNPFPTDAPIGGVSEYSDGYRFIKLADGSWVAEHRVIMEQVLGRPLTQAEIVHHRHGNTSDNNPDHLMVMSRSKHQEIHYQAERIGLREMWVHPIEGVEL